MKKIADYLNKSAVENVKNALTQAKTAEAEHIELSEAKDRAIKRAKLVDAGKISGKLAGVPFIVKNNFLIFGAKTSAGSKILEQFEAPYQATVVERLESEGAICIGSSADPAKLVALGVTPFALGFDADGSIAQSVISGDIIEFKPTYGMVSRYGVSGVASSIDTVGVLAANATDINQVLDIISGRDGADMTILPDYFAPTGRSKGSLKVAVIDELLTDSGSSAVGQIDQYIDILKKQGHTVERVSIPSIKYAKAIHQVVTSAELSSNMARLDGIRYGERTNDARSLEEVYIKTRAEFLGKDTKLSILLGSLVLSSDYYEDYYLQAQKVRTLLIQELQQALKEYDVLVSPSEPMSALLAGLPAINMPLGPVGAGGLLGIQLMAAPKNDALLLALASQVEGK